MSSLGPFLPHHLKFEGLESLFLCIWTVCLGPFWIMFYSSIFCLPISPLEGLDDPLIHLHHLLVPPRAWVQFQLLVDELVQAVDVHRGGLLEGLREVVGELGVILVIIIPGNLQTLVRQGKTATFKSWSG